MTVDPNVPGTRSLKDCLDDRRLREIAERIRARIRRTVADIIDTGLDLAQVKSAVDHGQFTDWIEREFSMSMRTAQRYMQAAEWAEGKNDIVSHLPPKTLYLLAAKSTSVEIQTDVLQSLEADKKPDIRQIEERVRDARWPAKFKGIDGEAVDATLLPPEPDRWSSKSARLFNKTTDSLVIKLEVMLEGDFPHLVGAERMVVLHKLLHARKEINSVIRKLQFALRQALEDRGT